MTLLALGNERLTVNGTKLDGWFQPLPDTVPQKMPNAPRMDVLPFPNGLFWHEQGVCIVPALLPGRSWSFPTLIRSRRTKDTRGRSRFPVDHESPPGQEENSVLSRSHLLTSRRSPNSSTTKDTKSHEGLSP